MSFRTICPDKFNLSVLFFYAAKLRELVEEKENAEKMLEEKMDRWEYLEELAAKIAGQQS